MNRPIRSLGKPLAAALASLLATACAMTPPTPEGAASVRADLTRLQADPQLASRAPVAIQEAELAVSAAEQPNKDKAMSRHLVMMADRKVDTALALAQTRLAEDQRGQLKSQRESVRLDARTLEAEQARSDANSARTDANIERSRAELAQMQTADLQKQIAALNARTTERGLIVTLGDVLFETGKSGLKGGSTSNLGKLASFLNTYKDRSIIIEGHTDSVGSEAANIGLSQRRAEAVRSYLARQGVSASRLSATGLGESAPVASNDSATGRQQNRRVEVIISNPVSTVR